MLSNPKVTPHWNHVVEEVIGDDERGMTGVRLKASSTAVKPRSVDAPGMFVAIGHTPNGSFLNGQLKTDSAGFIELIDPARTLTSVEGVFAAGDVADPTYKQAITAAGIGAVKRRWMPNAGSRAWRRATRTNR